MKGKKSIGGTKATSVNIDSESALLVLRSEHRKVEKLFQQFTDATTRDEKARLVKRVCAELLNQTKIEEEILLETWTSAPSGLGTDPLFRIANN